MEPPPRPYAAQLIRYAIQRVAAPAARGTLATSASPPRWTAPREAAAYVDATRPHRARRLDHRRAPDAASETLPPIAGTKVSRRGFAGCLTRERKRRQRWIA